MCTEVNLYHGSSIRCFTDIGDIHTMAPGYEWYWRKDKDTTCYAVGKLAFDLLPVLLEGLMSDRVKGVGMLEISPFLRRHPPFRLIKNDPLELEKVKAMRAIEEFLKV